MHKQHRRRLRKQLQVPDLNQPLHQDSNRQQPNRRQSHRVNFEAMF